MKIAIWLLVWALFFASIAGMSLSALLWTKSARAIVVNMWLECMHSVEEVDLSGRTETLCQEYLARLFLNERAQVSGLKLMALTFVSVVALAFSALAPFLLISVDSIKFLDFELITQILVLSVPMQYAMNYSFAWAYIKIFSSAASRSKSLERRVTHSALAGIFALVAAVALWYVIVLPYSLMMQPSSLGFWFILAGGAPLLISLALASLGSASSAGYLLTAVALASLSILVTASSAIGSFLYVRTSNSKRLLKIIALVCEALDKASPQALLAASLTLFAFSTGLMQAYTFPTSP